MAKKYKFKIENDIYEWESATITGAQVRSVGPGIPSNMDLYVKFKGQVGKLIKDSDVVDLEETNGVEKFYSQESRSTPGTYEFAI